MTNHNPAFSLRAPQMDEVHAVADFHNECSCLLDAKDEVTTAEMANFWQTPDISREDDLRIAIAPDGQILGYAEALVYGEPAAHPYIFLRVHPQHMDGGVTEALLDWAIARCQSVLDIVPAELRVSIGMHQPSTDTATADVLRSRGFGVIRHSFLMGIDLEAEPPAPEWPGGVELRPFDPKQYAPDVYRAVVDAFRDHFGFHEEPFESGFPRWQHMMIEEEAFDRDLWFIAWDGEEVAGVALCKEMARDGGKIGWVEDLGVRRPWRKRGLGKALLLHSFAAFYGRGLRHAGLYVDASNLTGALRLYEAAGMRMLRQLDRYERELRPGKEVMTTELTG
ncbi:MAG: GNAT family N-acetyltransferase [Anaerolineales bacterium]|nr:GNAT family N-acetyltransferase [Anaerolineales bacterium]